MTAAVSTPTPTAPAPTHATVVTDALGLSWHVTHDPYGLGLDALAGLALRDNPKRAHLIVSKVLAKHVPTRPSAARAAGLLLAGLVHERLAGQQHPELTADLLTDPDRSADVDRLATGALPADPIVIGYCETATSLGHTVADAFAGATYLHTTRHPDPNRPTLLGFDEAHSHAVAHYLQPLGTDQLDRDVPVVLVDDELTTGATALNTVEQLRAYHAYPRFVIATLLDMRTPAARAAFDERAATLGVRVDVVALLDGHLTLPENILERARPVQEQLRAHVPAPASASGVIPHVPANWPADVPLTARHGISPAQRPAFTAQIDRLVHVLTRTDQGLPARLHGHGPVLVLGTEECMIAAIRLAHALELHAVRANWPRVVHVQSTTRSPVLPHPHAGYAIRRALAFDCPTEPGRASFAYNLAPLDTPPDAPTRAAYEHLVVVTDARPAQLAGLLRALQPHSEHRVLVLADRARGGA